MKRYLLIYMVDGEQFMRAFDDRREAVIQTRLVDHTFGSAELYIRVDPCEENGYKTCYCLVAWSEVIS